MIQAVVERQGIVDADELEELYSGRANGMLRVPNEMREAMRDIGLGIACAVESYCRDQGGRSSGKY